MFETVNNVRYNNGTSKHIFFKARYGNHVSVMVGLFSSAVDYSLVHFYSVVKL